MRLLIIEDQKQISDFLKKNLEEECFIVDVFEDGEKGAFAARTNDYDVVILDNILPNKTGIEICKELRAANKSVPILMLSIKSEAATKAQLLDAGADDYLSKPFSFEELLARIRALLRRPKRLDSEVLTVDGLVLNTRAHVVTRDGKQIKLRRKEFILLEYLMKNAGEVLSRGMIMEHVWDMNADPFSNTIEAHILSLRRKINVEGGKQLIQTVPGRGYKISVG